MLGYNEDTIYFQTVKRESIMGSAGIFRGGGMFSSRAHYKITIKLPNILGGANTG